MKYSAASAVIFEVARNNCLRQRAMPGTSVTWISIVERKYDLSSLEGCVNPRHGQSRSAAVRRYLHVAEPGGDVDDGVGGIAEVVELDPIGIGHVRHRGRLDGHDHNLLVQDVVVLHVGAHG